MFIRVDGLLMTGIDIVDRVMGIIMPTGGCMERL
jgi:hypothetical protein